MGLAEKGRAQLIRAAEPLVNPPSAIDEGELRATVAGKIALVTGASYGLGEATARRLGAAGATVLLTARSGDRLGEIAAEIRAAGGDAHFHAADMTDTESVIALAEWVLAEHGHIDVVVSNAGKSIRRSVELSYDRFHDFERTIGVNYLGPVRLLLALLPSMRARGEGHIVNVSTIGTRIAPGPRWGAYQASKSAFDIWLRSVAPELRGDGITTTSIYMALIHTRMSAPTPIYRHVPGQTPEQATATICRAIVRRPRSIAPWWSPVADVGDDGGANAMGGGGRAALPLHQGHRSCARRRQGIWPGPGRGNGGIRPALQRPAWPARSRGIAKRRRARSGGTVPPAHCHASAADGTWACCPCDSRRGSPP